MKRAAVIPLLGLLLATAIAQDPPPITGATNTAPPEPVASAPPSTAPQPDRQQEQQQTPPPQQNQPQQQPSQPAQSQAPQQQNPNPQQPPAQNQPQNTPPPTPPRRTPPPQPKNQDALQWLSRSAVHTVFYGIIKQSNQTAMFTGERGITVYAPTNAGMLTTLRDLRYRGSADKEPVSRFWNALLKNRTNNLEIKQLVSYHVGRDRLTGSDIQAKADGRFADRFVMTYANLRIEVKEKGGQKTLQDNAKEIPNPKLSTSNVVVTNGVVHSIDRVLIPTNVNRKKLSADVVQLQKETGSGNVCFPMSATVRVADGEMSMGKLQGGHSVHVSETGASSPVFLFSHRKLGGMHDFVRITTQSGHSIALSAGHYLYANGRLSAASAVRVGDELRTLDGPSKVANVRVVRERGLVAPHTLHGDIVVNGVVASTYTTSVHPRAAQIILAPLRAVVRLGLATEPLGAALYDGADRMARLLPSGPERY